MNSRCFLLKNGTSVQKIPLDDVVYVMQKGKCTEIVAGNNTYTYKGALKNLERVFDARFYRCHRGYIINFQHVDALKDDEIYLDNGDIISVCKELYQRTKKEYLKYWEDQEKNIEM